MQRITINAEKREESGKGPARAMRRSGQTPGVIYREGRSTPIKLDKKELMGFLKSTAGQQVIVNLKLNDGSEKLALMKQFQSDPVKGDVLHVDFFEVSLTEKVSVTVPIVTVGEPIGVKRDGGILQHNLREIGIECLPDRIIGHVEVDVSGLSVGHSVHVRDLNLGEGIKVLTDPHEVITSVTAVVVEEAAPAEAEAAAEEEAAAEPEIVKKGKKEEAEA